LLLNYSFADSIRILPIDTIDTVTVSENDTVISKSDLFSKDFTGTLFGSTSFGVYLACFILALCGLFFRWYVTTKRGIKNNKNETPVKWNWEYWWKDNLVPFLLSLLFHVVTIFLSLRFVAEILPDNFQLPIGFVAVLFGICFDLLVNWWQNKKLPVINANTESK